MLSFELSFESRYITIKAALAIAAPYGTTFFLNKLLISGFFNQVTADFSFRNLS